MKAMGQVRSQPKQSFSEIVGMGTEPPQADVAPGEVVATLKVRLLHIRHRFHYQTGRLHQQSHITQHSPRGSSSSGSIDTDNGALQQPTPTRRHQCDVEKGIHPPAQHFRGVGNVHFGLDLDDFLMEGRPRNVFANRQEAKEAEAPQNGHDGMEYGQCRQLL